MIDPKDIKGSKKKQISGRKLEILQRAPHLHWVLPRHQVIPDLRHWGGWTVNLFDQLVVILALTMTRLVERIMIDNACIEIKLRYIEMLYIVIWCYSVQSRERPCWFMLAVSARLEKPARICQVIIIVLKTKSHGHIETARASLCFTTPAWIRIVKVRVSCTFIWFHLYTTFRASQILYRMSVYICVLFFSNALQF